MWCRKQDGGHGSWNPRKECVTTHLQNHTAPKTDGAQAVSLIARHLTIPNVLRYGISRRLVTIYIICALIINEAVHASDCQDINGADLGTSSKESY